MSKAEFGWTVICNSDGKWVIYKRDCPADAAHYAADLAATTFPTKREAQAYVARMTGCPVCGDTRECDSWECPGCGTV